MAPERSSKRIKPNPNDDKAVERIPTTEIPLPLDEAPTPTATILRPSTGDEANRTSWYGTWSRKATPVTQVARESISSASIAATEAVTAIANSTPTRLKAPRSPSLQIALGKSKVTRAEPIDAMMTKVHATSDGQSVQRKSTMGGKSETPAGPEQTLEAPLEEPKGAGPDALTTTEHSDRPKQETKEAPVQDNASWLPWLSKSAVVPEEVKKPQEDSSVLESHTKASEQQRDPPRSAETPEPGIEQGNENKRSWLQMWNAEPSVKVDQATDAPRRGSEPSQNSAMLQIQNGKLKTSSIASSHSKTSSIEISEPPKLPGDSSKSAGWILWARERNTNSSSSSIDQPHKGEIAISNTPSAGRPKRASISTPQDENLAVPKSEVTKKTARPQTPIFKNAKPISESKPSPANSKTDQRAPNLIDNKEASAASVPPAEPPNSSTSTASTRKHQPGLLLPSFSETFRPQANPGMIEQLGRLLYYTKPPESHHLSVIRDPPRIKSALAIGVHGYFPAPLVRSILGQPTGTSIKFADMAAKSVRRWTRSAGYECQVKTAALEGEGKIADRIELLWRLLLNWIEEIRKADFILVACHSQGVPVAIMLIAKLIAFGCVSNARIGVCAMAGVSLGPFIEYRSRWISGSAGELFEFSDQNSKVSLEYLKALEAALAFGAKVAYIGSIDDQLVSLESSLFAPITHPHIYRAVLIDGKVHAPNFLSHLVGFALKLRNLGVQDHGLIRELSGPLAGSLYSGEGHSRIYEDEAVYDLAVSFTLETNTILKTPIKQTKRTETAGISITNPYILPFAMRGMLEEEFVKNEMHAEAQQLLKQFDEWNPSTKVLRDLKFRLEGVRMKLDI